MHTCLHSLLYYLSRDAYKTSHRLTDRCIGEYYEDDEDDDDDDDDDDKWELDNYNGEQKEMRHVPAAVMCIIGMGKDVKFCEKYRLLESYAPKNKAAPGIDPTAAAESPL